MRRSVYRTAPIGPALARNAERNLMGCNNDSLVCDARHRYATAGRQPRFAALRLPGVKERRCDEHGYGRDHAVLEGGCPGIAARAALGGRPDGHLPGRRSAAARFAIRGWLVCWLAFGGVFPASADRACVVAGNAAIGESGCCDMGGATG